MEGDGDEYDGKCEGWIACGAVCFRCERAAIDSWRWYVLVGIERS